MDGIGESHIEKGTRLYAISSPEIVQCLCQLEMKYLFQQSVTGNSFLSNIAVDPSRSPFIRHMIAILFYAESLDTLVEIIKSNRVSYDKFKFVHFKIKDGDLGYQDWIEAVTKIGEVINGESDFENPAILLGLQKFEGKWIFGFYERNDNKWMNHARKPHNNSHSLGVVTAKALVNIAAGSSMKCRLVDPCCGVGTVVLEALSMAVNVKGFEINQNISLKAIENIESFGYANVISNSDMHRIEEHFDVAVIDIPYGHFTPVSIGDQAKLIESARRIADRLILVAYANMEDVLLASGFNVIDSCQVTKGYFKRHIAVCS